MALAVLVLAAGLAAASDQTDVMTTVNQFVDGFNKGDMKAASAVCADQASIIDDFPPHAWSGSGACAAWASDYEAFAKQNGLTDGIVTLAKPKHIEVTGDVAYVVIPADFTYMKQGKPTKEQGATFVLVLKKAAAGWRITAWTWGEQ